MDNTQNPTSFNPMSTAAVSAAGGFGSAIIGAIANAVGAKKQRKWNEKMFEKQNAFNAEQAQIGRDWEEAMWNQQNEYNTPLAQAQRLRDAGLNPLFVGLDGTGNAGAIGSAQSASSGSPLGIDNPLAGAAALLGDAPVKAAQIQSLLAGADLAKANANKAEAETDYQEMVNQVKAATKDNEIEISNITVKFEEGKVQEQQEAIANLKIERENIVKSWSFMAQDLDVKRQNLALQNAQFEFNKWLDQQKLSQEDRRIAIEEFNATTQRIFTNATVANLDADTGLKTQQHEVREANKDKEIKANAQQYNATRQTAVASAYIGMAKDVTGMVSDVVGAAMKGVLKGTIGKGKFGHIDGPHSSVPYNNGSMGHFSNPLETPYSNYGAGGAYR